MQRITGADVATNLHGTGKHGFKERVAGISAPTIVTAQFANDVQEELCRTVEGYGFTLGASNRQLLNVASCAAIESAVLNHTQRMPDNSFPGAFVAAFVMGSGLIVASGFNDEIQTSPDGVTWTRREPPHNPIYSAIYAGTYSAALGLAVLGAYDGYLTSPDGITWTRRAPPAGFSSGLTDGAYGNGVFVFVGYLGEIQTSPNGVNWTRRTADNGYAQTWQAVTFGNGLFVAVGDGGEIQTSPDGINWTKRQVAIAQAVLDVTYAGGLFVAVGFSSQIQTSTNGIDWVRRSPIPPWTYHHFWGVCAREGAAGTMFLAVGDHGLMAISADGLDWRVLHRPDRYIEWLWNCVYHPQTSTFLAFTLEKPGCRQTLAV